MMKNDSAVTDKDLDVCLRGRHPATSFIAECATNDKKDMEAMSKLAGGGDILS
jgi:hypothetical protein